MANDKKKKTTYTTPKGSALFAHVKDIDYGTDKFPIPDGQFVITLVLSEHESEALKQKLEQELSEAEVFAEEKFDELKPVTKKKLGNLSFNPVCNEEYDKDGNETGNFLWRFKTAAFMKDKLTGKKKQRLIPVFDSIGQPVKLKDELGNGSIVRVAFTTNPYFVEGQGMGGLSLYLSAVQLLKLEQFGQRDAKSYGFGQEDGYVADEDTSDGDSPYEEEAPRNATDDDTLEADF